MKLAYIGVAEDGTPVGTFRALTTLKEVVSSLEKDSTRRGGGGGLGLEVPPGNGEKLPGGLGGPLVGAGCILSWLLVTGSVGDKGLPHLRSYPGCPWWVSGEGQAHRKTITGKLAPIVQRYVPGSMLPVSQIWVLTDDD